MEYALVAPSVAAFFEAHGTGPRDVGPWHDRLLALGAAEERPLESDSSGAVYAFAVDGTRHRVAVEPGERGVDVRPANDAGER
ncbi:hypothetical protein BRC81_06975 [Halobacteriales archaeon QS_1_68_20]|nr:MAG: hypothetical protein BRC81_06975 [Halobacteriales archaeon QS_1_68_20]